MLGCSSAKRPRRLTSHLAAKSGDVLTVSAPEVWRCSSRWIPRGNAVEGVAQGSEVLATGLGDNETLALAIEELDPELLLQRLDLVAYRALRDE
jgi:hypothetical protein